MYNTRSKTYDASDDKTHDTSARNVQASPSKRGEDATGPDNVTKTTEQKAKMQNPFEAGLSSIRAFISPPSGTSSSRAPGGEDQGVQGAYGTFMDSVIMEKDAVQESESKKEIPAKTDVTEIEFIDLDDKDVKEDDSDDECDPYDQVVKNDMDTAKKALDDHLLDRLPALMEPVLMGHFTSFADKLHSIQSENAVLKEQLAEMRDAVSEANAGGKAVDKPTSDRVHALEKEIVELKMSAKRDEESDVKEAKIRSLVDSAVKSTVPATPPAQKPMPDDAPSSIAIIATELKNGIIEAMKAKDETKGGKRLDFGSMIPFTFMRASEYHALDDSITKVEVSSAIRRVPHDKGTRLELIKSTGEEVMLSKFSDTVSHETFVEYRRELVEKLAATGYDTLSLNEGLTRQVVEDQLARRMKNSLEYFNGRDDCTKLSTVLANVNSKHGEEMSVADMLLLMDERFAAPTGVERDREISDGLGKLTIENGVSPTQMIAQAELMYSKQFANNPDLVDRQTRSFVTQSLTTQAAKYPFVKVFCDKLNDVHFSKAPMSEWRSQFNVYEKQPDFTKGLSEAVAKGKATTKTGKAADQHSKGLNALMGGDTGALNVQGPGGAGLLKQIASIIVTGDAAQLTNNTANMDDESSVDFLAKLVAAVEDSRKAAPPSGPSLGALVAAITVGKVKDEAWVLNNGVPGFPAPNDSRRPVIHVGKVMAALGMAIPDGCPKDPHALVGPNCPCNAFRMVPTENWYYAPMSEEFKSGKAEYSRVKPVDLKHFGYYHKLGKCKTMYEKAHELAKADPSKVTLLVPLPRECKDCITVE